MTPEEVDRQKKLKSVELYGDLVKHAVRERYKLLPTISALAATLLIVATFNERLLPLERPIIALLVILLLLIPASLIGYLYELHKSESHGLNKLQEISNGTDERDPGDMEPKFRNSIPWGITAVLTEVIGFIIFFILYYR